MNKCITDNLKQYFGDYIESGNNKMGGSDKWLGCGNIAIMTKCFWHGISSEKPVDVGRNMNDSVEKVKRKREDSNVISMNSIAI